MKNWFADNFLTAGFLFSLLTALVYYSGVAYENGFIDGLGIPSGLFKGSFYEVLVLGTTILSTVFLSSSVIKVLMLAAVGPAVVYGLNHLIFKEVERDKSHTSRIYFHSQTTLTFTLILVLSAGFILSVFVELYKQGEAQAKKDLTLNSEETALERILISDLGSILGHVLKCSDTHCAILSSSEIIVVPVSDIRGIALPLPFSEIKD